MAISLDELFPQLDASIALFDGWLATAIRRFGVERIWVDDGHKELWKEFVARRQFASSANWVHLDFDFPLSPVP